MQADIAVFVFLGLLPLLLSSSAARYEWPAGKEEEGDGERGEVTYDGRALIINGTRAMLFSGEIHYTRSTPEVHDMSSKAGNKRQEAGKFIR
uniref:Uncharacterized protein n=1 Tax=Leersia perrieri TaxID=77586 RepID=A0A0D9WGU0_9ORYZ